MKQRIYLDYNASAPVKPAVQDAMMAAMQLPGNPSSVHSAGRAARKMMENARQQVATAINAKTRDIVFTGSGTEANNLVMEVTPERRLVIGAAEHDSLIAPAKKRDQDISIIPVLENGVLDLDALRRNLAENTTPALLSFMLLNNETGIVQPVEEIANLAREFGAYFHCDAVHGFGKLPVDFATMGCDLMSIAAHKIGGPKGVGALVVREGLGPFPSIIGGGQERRWRAGTENLIGNAGFGAAASLIQESLAAMAQTDRLRQWMEAEITAHAPDACILGKDSPRGPNTTCVVMPGKNNESQVMQFDLAGYDVSAGAACSSGKVGVSHVLQAMKIPEEQAACAIRISLGPETSEQEIRAFVAEWCRLYDRKK